MHVADSNSTRYRGRRNPAQLAWPGLELRLKGRFIGGQRCLTPHEPRQILGRPPRSTKASA